MKMRGKADFYVKSKYDFYALLQEQIRDIFRVSNIRLLQQIIAGNFETLQGFLIDNGPIKCILPFK